MILKENTRKKLRYRIKEKHLNKYLKKGTKWITKIKITLKLNGCFVSSRL